MLIIHTYCNLKEIDLRGIVAFIGLQGGADRKSGERDKGEDVQQISLTELELGM